MNQAAVISCCLIHEHRPSGKGVKEAGRQRRVTNKHIRIETNLFIYSNFKKKLAIIVIFYGFSLDKIGGLKVSQGQSDTDTEFSCTKKVCISVSDALDVVRSLSTLSTVC